MRGQAECPGSSCQGGPAGAPGNGRRSGGQGPATQVLSHSTERGQGAGKARLQVRGARVSEVPHLPSQCTVGVRPLPALGCGDPRGY